jgi:DNA-binding response OmpR family regulator
VNCGFWHGNPVCAVALTYWLGTVTFVQLSTLCRSLGSHLFEAEGYAVEIHGDGQSALESIHAFPPAIIVLDLRLPKLSGRDVCKKVKAESPTLPIVVLSAASDISDKILQLELGADDYVTKPFSQQCVQPLWAQHQEPEDQRKTR